MPPPAAREGGARAAGSEREMTQLDCYRSLVRRDKCGRGPPACSASRLNNGMRDGRARGRNALTHARLINAMVRLPKYVSNSSYSCLSHCSHEASIATASLVNRPELRIIACGHGIRHGNKRHLPSARGNDARHNSVAKILGCGG